MAARVVLKMELGAEETRAGHSGCEDANESTSTSKSTIAWASAEPSSL